MNNFFKKIFAKGKKSLRICNPKIGSDNVGWGLSLRDLHITRRRRGRLGKKSINNCPCHPELVSGSGHQQKCSANCSQKSNVGVETPTYFNFSRNVEQVCQTDSNISLNTNKRGIIVQCFRQHSPRRAAFTLAEVLITLGIIGVVAVMTLPTLIQNYQKHITVNRLKVNYNILNNAVRRAEADFGEITTWDELLNSYSTDYDGNKPAVKLQAASIIKKYLMPYLSGAQLTETKSLAQLGYKRPILNAKGSIFAPINATGPILTLKNGTVILISIDISNPDAEGKKYLYGLNLVIDIDGPNGYNTKGKDVFLASLPYARNTRVMFHQNYRVFPNTRKMEIISINREDLKINCKTSNGNYCGALIQMDGWQIKDDYPWF